MLCTFSQDGKVELGLLPGYEIDELVSQNYLASEKGSDDDLSQKLVFDYLETRLEIIT
jgi:hypothetical protein